MRSENGQNDGKQFPMRRVRTTIVRDMSYADDDNAAALCHKSNAVLHYHSVSDVKLTKHRR